MGRGTPQPSPERGCSLPRGATRAQPARLSHSPLHPELEGARARLTHPEIVEHLAYPLVVSRDLCGEVLIEAGLDRAPHGQGRPVVLSHYVGRGEEVSPALAAAWRGAHAGPVPGPKQGSRGVPADGAQGVWIRSGMGKDDGTQIPLSSLQYNGPQMHWETQSSTA